MKDIIAPMEITSKTPENIDSTNKIIIWISYRYKQLPNIKNVFKNISF